MSSVVYKHPYDVDERLQRLGFTRDEWIEVVRACVAGRSSATDNDPVAAGGLLAYILGTRRMREVFRSKGLQKESLNGVETISDHDRKIRVAVVSTDSGTADPDRSPKNRTGKGPASERIVDLNNQYEMGFYDSDGNPIEAHDHGDGYSNWYLCVFDDGNEVRAELSSPVEFKSGYFVKFSERIFILGPGDWDKVITSSPDEDSGEVYQIDISRK